MRPHAAILLMVLAGPLAAQVTVVNPSVPELSLDAARVTALLLGRSTTWSDGSLVVLVLVDDPAADAELLSFAGRPRERLLRGWKRLVFSGLGSMPLEAPNRAAALELVARVPGAVVLLSEAANDPHWRVLPVARPVP